MQKNWIQQNSTHRGLMIAAGIIGSAIGVPPELIITVGGGLYSIYETVIAKD